MLGSTYILFQVLLSIRLQNSRFLPFSERAKRRKRDPRVWSARASHALPLPILPRRFYTRSRPFVRIFTASLAFAKNTIVLQSSCLSRQIRIRLFLHLFVIPQFYENKTWTPNKAYWEEDVKSGFVEIWTLLKLRSEKIGMEVFFRQLGRVQ